MPAFLSNCKNAIFLINIKQCVLNYVFHCSQLHCSDFEKRGGHDEGTPEKVMRMDTEDTH